MRNTKDKLLLTISINRILGTSSILDTKRKREGFPMLKWDKFNLNLKSSFFKNIDLEPVSD